MTSQDKTLAALAAWLLCFSMSFFHGFLFGPTSSDPLSQGLDRVSTFIAWQSGALLTAVLALILSRGIDKGIFPILRRLGIVPVVVMALEVVVLVAGYFYVNTMAVEIYEPTGRPTDSVEPLPRKGNI